MTKQQNVLIIGAGLCGSLLALRLGQRGYNVSVMEMRQDLRKVDISGWTLDKFGLFRSW